MSITQTVGLLVLKEGSVKGPEEATSASFDIVAVHGLNGDRIKSWTHTHSETNEEVMWLADLLPARMPNARIMTFGYNSDIGEITSATGIREEAFNLLTALRDKRNLGQEASPIVFVGHGLGGTIIKQALCIASSGGMYLSIAASASCLVFFGTPHQAADIPSWKRIIFNVVAAPYGGFGSKEFLSRSATITLGSIIKVSEEFNTIADKYNILSLYETAHTPLLGSVVVEEDSAILGIPSEEKISLQGDHLSMCKFSKEGGEKFESLCEKIKHAGAVEFDEGYIGCLQALSALNPEISLSNILPPHPGTFNWVTAHETFSAWTASRTCDSLLLEGPPGVGKTVLSSFLLKALRTTDHNPAPATVYFSFDNKDQRRGSARKLLISFVYQLLFRKPSRFRLVRHLYHLVRDHASWTNKELWEFFRAILLDLPAGKVVIFVIDALDACDSSRTQLLGDLIKLGSVTNCIFKVVATSRPHLDICNLLKPRFTINLAAELGMRTDVANFAASGILDLAQRVPIYTKFQSLLSETLHQPDKTFLTVTIVLDRLMALKILSTPESILYELGLLKCNLFGLYERILQGIPREDQSWAHKALSWILHAFRPMKTHQLAIALAIEHDKTFGLVEKSISLDIVGDLKRVLGPLIRIRNDDIYFVHQSVRDFLLSVTVQRNSVWYRVKNTAHADIAWSCLIYLSMSEFGNGSSFVEYDDDGLPGLVSPRTRIHELLTYAAQYWPAHYQKAADIPPSLLSSVIQFLEAKKHVRMWSELYWLLGDPRRDRSSDYPLYIASELGLVKVVKILLGKESKSPVAPRIGRVMSLSLAAQNGHTELVKQLLKAGVGAGSAINHITALHLAATEGHKSVARVLLFAGADVSAVDDTGSTPLHLAARNGHLAVAELLLNAGAEVNVFNDAGLVPLHLAARDGYSMLVEQFLNVGADSSLLSSNGSAALHMAAMGGHELVVEILLQAGADGSAIDITMSTPLHLAARNGYLAVVKLLLDTGVYEDVIDDTESTPLHLAAQNGQLAVARQLLRAAADVNATNDIEATPLHLAAGGGHATVVRVLLEAGADTERRMRRGWTPLHSAFGDSDAVKLLLKFGADVNASNDLGSTPLTLAAEDGSEEVVEILLHAGADSNAKSKDGATPLHRAAQSGYLGVVKLLLTAGADPWAETSKHLGGITPLQLADTLGYQDVVRELQSTMENHPRMQDSDDVDSLLGIEHMAPIYQSQSRRSEWEKLETQRLEFLRKTVGEEDPDILKSMVNLASIYQSQWRWEEAEKLEKEVFEVSKRVFGEENPKTLKSMSSLASIYWNQDRFEETEVLEEQVLEISKRVFGEEHPDTLNSMAALILTYRNQNRWKEAEEMALRVVEMSKRVFGGCHPTTLASMEALASTYSGQSMWKEAENLRMEILQMSKQFFGSEHPKTLTSMASLASTYWDQNRWKEAEELQMQVLKASKMVFGENHPDTLSRMAALVPTYRSQSRWKEAEEMALQVLEVSGKVFGGDHLAVLTSMEALASTYFDQSLWKKAEELRVRILQVLKKTLGEKHQKTLASMAALASIYWHQERWEEAEELQVRVLEASREIFGDDHPTVVTSMETLASAFLDQSRWKEAEKLQVRLLEISKRTLKKDHPDILNNMVALALTYWNQSQWVDAEMVVKQALEILERTVGKDHPDTLESMTALASIHWNQGRFKEVEASEEQILKISKKVLGQEHPDTLTRMANLASTYWGQGRTEEAEELEVQALEISKRVLGEDHPDTLARMTNLASAYWDQGQIEKAEELEVQALEMSKRILGEDHPDTLAMATNLASIYRDQGRVEEAEKLERLMPTNELAAQHGGEARLPE